jgi:hypothetical protein
VDAITDIHQVDLAMFPAGTDAWPTTPQWYRSLSFDMRRVMMLAWLDMCASESHRDASSGVETRARERAYLLENHFGNELLDQTWAASTAVERHSILLCLDRARNLIRRLTNSTDDQLRSVLHNEPPDEAAGTATWEFQPLQRFGMVHLPSDPPPPAGPTRASAVMASDLPDWFNQLSRLQRNSMARV